MDEQQRAEWNTAGNPSRLMRSMRQATRSAPWLLQLLAGFSETGFGGRPALRQGLEAGGRSRDLPGVLNSPV